MSLFFLSFFHLGPGNTLVGSPRVSCPARVAKNPSASVWLQSGKAPYIEELLPHSLLYRMVGFTMVPANCCGTLEKLTIKMIAGIAVCQTLFLFLSVRLWRQDHSYLRASMPSPCWAVCFYTPHGFKVGARSFQLPCRRHLQGFFKNNLVLSAHLKLCLQVVCLPRAGLGASCHKYLLCVTARRPKLSLSVCKYKCVDI